MLRTLFLAAMGAAKVEVLTTGNFEKFIEDNERVLVEFYAPWCGHCKALEPEYTKAAEQLGNTGAETKLAKVDATVETDLAQRFEVQGFPTLKYFNGDPTLASEYGGGRTSETIVSWINKRELPAVTMVRDEKTLANLKTKEKLVLVAFCEENSAEAAAVAEFAKQARDDVVVGRADPSLSGQTAPSYSLFRKFADDSVTGTDFQDLEKFFKTNRFPVIDEIGPENYKLYMNRGLPMAWLSVARDDSKSRTAAEKVAADFKGDLSLVWVDSVKYKQHVESNIGIKNVPGLMIVTEENQKFLYDGDMTEGGLRKFLDDWKQGVLEAFTKTQPAPEKNDDPVTVIVGKTFHALVKENKKQGKFVEYYAPWCGHCKKLAPIWEELGAKYADEGRMMIAKVDATENDTPESIQGFPTLIYYDREGMSEKFQGGRELEDLTNFVEEKLHEMEEADAEKSGQQGAGRHDEL